MSKRIFLFFYIIFYTAFVYSQAIEYKQVYSTDELKDSAECFITCVKSSQFRNLVCTKDLRCNMVYDFKSSSKYNDIGNLASSTQKFRIKKIEGKFYLYIPEYNSFVSFVNQSITSETALYNMFAFTSDARNEITFSSLDNITELKIGEKIIRFHRTADTYRAINKITADYSINVQLYLIQEKGEDPILELSSNTDLTNTKFTGTIKFNRKFEIGYYNTLVLPFSIISPWEVFGENVEIYKPVMGNANEIRFNKLKKGDIMSSYTPYLLGGTFNSPPYIIKNVTLNYNSVGTKLKTNVGNQILYSVFQRKQLGNTENYVLYMNQLRNCQKVKSLYIEPYKWYLLAPNSKVNSRNWGKIIYLHTNE